MQGGVNYSGSTILSGGINVNTTGNIQALNVQVTENGERTITPPEGVDGYAPITIDTNVPIPEPILNTLNATSNGTYTPPSGVDGYDVVNVSVPGPVLDNISITANGTYTPPSGVDGYDEVNVSVPTPEPVLDTLNVTSNGTYTPPSGVDGYDEVNVSVSGYTIKTLPNTPTPIATFSDGTDNPLKSLTVSIEPVQAGSGDPSPTNVRPISGWTEEVITRTGKNLCKSTVHGYVSSTDDLIIVYNDAESAIFYAHEGQTYTISSSATMNKSRVALVGTDNVVNLTPILQREILANNVNTWTATWTGWTVWYKCSSRQTAFDNSTQVEIGSTATDYEPYNGTTTTIPFTDGQGQSHTSYGGQIDVISGKEDDTYGIYQKTNFGLPTTKDNKNRWEFGTDLPDVLSDLIGSMTRATTDYDLMCNNMTIKLEGSASVGETTCSLYGHSNRVEWRIRISDEYTAEEAQAIANASVIRYPINIVTLQQQPTYIKSLDGENTVSASTGDVEDLKYFADL